MAKGFTVKANTPKPKKKEEKTVQVQVDNIETVADNTNIKAIK